MGRFTDLFFGRTPDTDPIEVEKVRGRFSQSAARIAAAALSLPALSGLVGVYLTVEGNKDQQAEAIEAEREARADAAEAEREAREAADIAELDKIDCLGALDRVLVSVAGNPNVAAQIVILETDEDVGEFVFTADERAACEAWPQMVGAVRDAAAPQP